MTTITRRLASAALALALAAPLAARATDLSLPAGARPTLQSGPEPGSYSLPTGGWREEGGIPVTRGEGLKTRTAWRIDAPSATTLQILAPLRDQMEAAGYAAIFDCASAGCGGFDFRFETEVLPGPAMYVNLSDYRFVALRRGQGPGADLASLLVSRSAAAGFVQLIELKRSAPSAGTEAVPAPQAPPPPATGDLGQRLEAAGHVVLRDLQFASGSDTLGEERIASLDRLAAYLASHPDRRLIFVGHTDATGSLEANIALSRRRAAAAVNYLVTRHGTPAGQLSADGVGYLSPLSTNLTEEGRSLNRRIEAVLASTE